jgi:putative heme-binding domain-containing protein
VKLLIRGMEKALEGRQLKRVPPELEKHLNALWKNQPGDFTILRFALRLGSVPAYDRALKLAADRKTPQGERAALIGILGQVGKPQCVDVLLPLLDAAEPDAVRLAALSGLQPFPDRKIAARVLALYPKMPAPLRGRAQTLLCSRPASALAFLKAVDAGRIAPKEVPLDQLRRVTRFSGKEIHRLVRKHWGKVSPATAGEKLTRMRNITTILHGGKGDRARGKVLFAKHCGICHTLFGEGNKVGPDLTGADRKNLPFLLTSIIDPSAVIRAEYLAYNVETTDGRSLTGLVVESGPKAVTLLNEKNERTVIARSRIHRMKASPVSLMPEKILDALSEQEIRDLFGYLQGDGPAESGRPPKKKTRRKK